MQQFRTQKIHFRVKNGRRRREKKRAAKKIIKAKILLSFSSLLARVLVGVFLRGACFK